VARAHKRIVGDQVGCGKAQLAATLVAVHDLAAHLKRGTEKAGSLLDLAGEQQAANVAG
jgi:hypothetical protein